MAIVSNAVKEYLKEIYLKVSEDNPPQPGDAVLRKFFKLDNPDHKHQFITIALPNDTDLKTLKKKIYSLDYKYLKGALLRVENFSANGQNLHIHILKEHVYSKCRVIRDMSRKWKVEKNFVNVRLGKQESDYQHRLNYVNGLKKDDDKTANVELDKKWRSENGLDEIYII